MNNLFAWIALSSNDYIGPRRMTRILKKFPNPEAYLDLSSEEQMAFLHIKVEKAQPFFQNMKKRAEEILNDCQHLGIRVVTREDPEYPQRLCDISDAPFLLYVRGQLKPGLKKVGVVGTRRASEESREINRYFVREMVHAGLGIVSGLAAGHDSIAQQQTIDLGGYTIAILGNGIDRAYPVVNRRLYDRILENGAIVSEYPPRTAVQKWFFPLRNRIISGLSDGILVVQAPERSGALITATYAEEQRRELYAIPGSLTDPRNTGNNRLIQNGAKMVLEPNDLIRDLIGEVKSNPAFDPEVILHNLDEQEREVYQLLDIPRTADEIFELLKLEGGSLNALLMKLELKGVVAQDFGRLYSRVTG